MTERSTLSCRREIHAGFVPLTDCAPLIVAKKLGFDREADIELILHRQVSWAVMRDKLEAGLFDCAIMLAPLPLASTLGLGGRAPVSCAAVMATSLNGNAITVSMDLYQAMITADHAATTAGGMMAAKALKCVISERRLKEQELLTLGIVYPFSCHNYDLRYWLAAAGIDPDIDVNLVVVPPPLIAGSLRSGRIDGFCVGEPWNSVAAANGDGIILTTKRDLWNPSPEKVLSVRQSLLTAQPDLVAELVSALTNACRWLSDHNNRRQAAVWLAEGDVIGTERSTIEAALLDGIGLHASSAAADTIIFDANTPRLSHAIWLLTQMIRAGQAPNGFAIEDIARRVYRSDVYASAVGRETDAAMDLAAASGEGFFGGDAFDPKYPLDYLKALPLLSSSVDLSRYA